MWRKFLLSALLVLAAGCNSRAADRHAEGRADMLEAIRESVLRTEEHTGKKELSPAVMARMGDVPRHEFVIPAYAGDAYLNTALPIEHGQTISQPLIVALMTDFLDPEPGDTMLEVGTGSGYQAAVLAGLVKRVYSVEIIPALARSAAAVLDRLGYDNVTVEAGDGYLGRPEYAPFDGIVVTAAADEVPPPLIEQLKPGARLVIPVASPGGYQELTVIEKRGDGRISERSVLPVRFVPLTGDR